MIRDWTLMGIVNVTPDSFSDGGKFLETDKAIAHGLQLIEDGADILDIGGESTRPGSLPLSTEDEILRIRPVIEGLAGKGARLSVDTRNARTMQMALEYGVDIINDISALSNDIEAFTVIAPAQCDVILMHMQGTPQTMQSSPHYDDVVREVYEYLSERIDICMQAGINQHRIMIDPGIGFGKTLEHNLTLLNNLDKFAALGTRLVLGTSRKRFIEALHPGANAGRRLGGSIASVLAAYQKGVRIFRVHDVFETNQALSITAAISQG
jgi:dihydropteroate synthase